MPDPASKLIKKSRTRSECRQPLAFYHCALIFNLEYQRYKLTASFYASKMKRIFIYLIFFGLYN